MTCSPFFTVTPLRSVPCLKLWIPYHFIISLVQWKSDKESSVYKIHLLKLIFFLITNLMNNSKLSWKENVKKRKVTTHLKFCWDQIPVSQRSDHHPHGALRSDSSGLSTTVRLRHTQNYRNQPLLKYHFIKPLFSLRTYTKWLPTT